MVDMGNSRFFSAFRILPRVQPFQHKMGIPGRSICRRHSSKSIICWTLGDQVHEGQPGLGPIFLALAC
jgi:hypothetical protein